MACYSSPFYPAGGGEGRRLAFCLAGIVGHDDQRDSQSGTRMGKLGIGNNSGNERDVSCGSWRRFREAIHLVAAHRTKTQLQKSKTEKRANPAVARSRPRLAPLKGT
jgi:hypothetical protein